MLFKRGGGGWGGPPCSTNNEDSRRREATRDESSSLSHQPASRKKKKAGEKGRRGGRLWMVIDYPRLHHNLPRLAGESPYMVSLHPFGPGVFLQDRSGFCWLRSWVRRELVEVIFCDKEYMDSNLYQPNILISPLRISSAKSILDDRY